MSRRKKFFSAKKLGVTETCKFTRYREGAPFFASVRGYVKDTARRRRANILEKWCFSCESPKNVIFLYWVSLGVRIILRAASRGQHPAGSIPRAASCGQHPAGSILRAASRGLHPGPPWPTLAHPGPAAAHGPRITCDTMGFPWAWASTFATFVGVSGRMSGPGPPGCACAWCWRRAGRAFGSARIVPAASSRVCIITLRTVGGCVRVAQAVACGAA